MILYQGGETMEALRERLDHLRVTLEDLLDRL